MFPFNDKLQDVAITRIVKLGLQKMVKEIWSDNNNIQFSSLWYFTDCKALSHPLSHLTSSYDMDRARIISIIILILYMKPLRLEDIKCLTRLIKWWKFQLGWNHQYLDQRWNKSSYFHPFRHSSAIYTLNEYSRWDWFGKKHNTAIAAPLVGGFRIMRSPPLPAKQNIPYLPSHTW